MALSPTSSHGFAGGMVAGATTFAAPVTIAPSGVNDVALTFTPTAAQDVNDTAVIVMDVASATNNLLATAAGEVEWTLDDVNGSVGLQIQEASTGKKLISARAATPVGLAYGIKANPIASGALPTVAPVSTTPFQCSTTRDVFLTVPFTGDATNNAATLKIELSPDNVTYSILDTLSIAAALNLTGAINTPVTVAVPAAWYVKLTATHGTIGTSTYY